MSKIKTKNKLEQEVELAGKYMRIYLMYRVSFK